jgi:hypothetical protein
MAPLCNLLFWTGFGLILIVDGIVKLRATWKVYRIQWPWTKLYRDYVPDGAYRLQGIGEILAGTFFLAGTLRCVGNWEVCL